MASYFVDPSVRPKIDFLSAHLEAWQSLFHASDDLFRTIDEVTTKSDPNMSQLVRLMQSDCNSERTSLYSRYDNAALALRDGRNLEETPPIVCNLPFGDNESFRHLRSKIVCPSEPMASANQLRPSSSPFGPQSNLYIDVTDRSHTSLGLVEHNDNGMSYAAAVQKPSENICPPQMPLIDFHFQNIRDKVQKPDHYNTLENTASTRYFIMRPQSANDVILSIHFGYWSASTPNINLKLNEAFNETKAANSTVYIFFSLTDSEEFCGVAQMISNVSLCTKEDWLPSYTTVCSGKQCRFGIQWLYVKDVPFARFKIREQSMTPERRPALVKDAPDGTEIASTLENRLIGRRLVHSYHDLCPGGHSLIQDKSRFRTFWPALRKIICPGAPSAKCSLNTVDDIISIDDLTAFPSVSDSPPVESNDSGACLSPDTPILTSPVADVSARFFICRPQSMADVAASFEKNLWSAGSVGGHGRLHKAFTSLRAKSIPGHVYLFFAVWGKDKFCGVAEMTSTVNFNASATWLPSLQEKSGENGEFHLKWKHKVDVAFSNFSDHLFALSSAKGKHCDISMIRDCDELLTVSDGHLLMAFFENAPHKTLERSISNTRRQKANSIGNESTSSLPNHPTHAVKTAVTKIVSVKHRGNSDAENQLFICGVCRTRGPAKPVHLSCGHSCHEGCYAEWIKRNAPAQCPVCRIRESRRKPISMFGGPVF